MCTNCEEKLNQMELDQDMEILAHSFENVNVWEAEDDNEVQFKVPTDSSVIDSPLQSTPATPGSLYQPSEMSLTMTEDTTPKDHLNVFLASRDISPIRTSLKAPWNDISQRTKRLYTRKAKQVVDACLDELAPNQQQHLLRTLFNKDCNTNKNIDSALLEVIVECYNNADHKSTRRQILSIMADKIPLKELQEWIPNLTGYRYNIARQHLLLHGRGMPVSVTPSTRVYVAPEKLDHFLNFITSAHVVQDLPFGEKYAKLSSNTEIKVPNVIRTMIPEQIVKQYQSYCEESGFIPMSRSTLHRVMKVCSASTRKSLQGLDNFSAEGAKAYDDLEEVVQTLGDKSSASLSWAKEISENLKQSKRYLKTDYKSGHKAKPKEVSKSICKARSLSGEPIFKADEYLTSQQIASFFSRETAKKKDVSKDQEEVEREVHLQVLQNDVIETIAIRHPIMHGNYNICECTSNQKLARFSILVLQDICTTFELEVSSIKVKRKQPYIMLIEALVGKCSCKS